MLPGSIGRGGGGAAAPELSFVVVKEWAFSEKKKRGVEVVEKPPFFSELWMMMAAFGEESRERGGFSGEMKRQRQTES